MCAVLCSECMCFAVFLGIFLACVHLMYHPMILRFHRLVALTKTRKKGLDQKGELIEEVLRDLHFSTDTVSCSLVHFELNGYLCCRLLEALSSSVFQSLVRCYVQCTESNVFVCVVIYLRVLFSTYVCRSTRVLTSIRVCLYFPWRT